MVGREGHAGPAEIELLQIGTVVGDPGGNRDRTAAQGEAARARIKHDAVDLDGRRHGNIGRVGTVKSRDIGGSVRDDIGRPIHGRIPISAHRRTIPLSASPDCAGSETENHHRGQRQLSEPNFRNLMGGHVFVQSPSPARMPMP